MKKVLIISVGAGGGHKAASEALKKAGEILFPDSSFKHIDILDYANPIFKKSYPGSYILMAKHLPQLWGYFYETTEKFPLGKLEKEIQDWLGAINTSKISDELKDFSPDSIIVTHFFAGSVLCFMKRKHKVNQTISCVVTDHDVHTYWLQNEIDTYFVSNDEVSFILDEKGVSRDRIKITGIPINPKFTSLPSKEDARKELGLKDTDSVILISSGGEGTGNLIIATEICLKVAPSSMILVIAGNNGRALKELNKLAKEKPNLKPFGFVKNMEVLMSASDLLIAKSGGLTSSEALATGLPMIIVSPIPGQEERNATFLLEAGAALQAYGPGSLGYKVSSLINDLPRLKRMRDAALKASKPQAAMDIMREVMK